MEIGLAKTKSRSPEPGVQVFYRPLFSPTGGWPRLVVAERITEPYMVVIQILGEVW